ncbi:hypothetical protein [Streptosporangium lutulentum]|uniref:Uncharacterized protein n=1 Tax=Streptosporangium lutulentum TaxID=1461250 RepID=A0ABT9QDA9_9ACTN|nr:hypothetical protein [Streptosporangium lutulentum]MDP9844370.1 hypothetical protein [Streptosporangium lutulentum]
MIGYIRWWYDGQDERVLVVTLSPEGRKVARPGGEDSAGGHRKPGYDLEELPKLHRPPIRAIATAHAHY